MLNDFLSLVLPEVCINCSGILTTGEQCFCTFCIPKLPKLGNDPQMKNSVERRLWGKTNISEGIGYLKYLKTGITQKALFALKYEGNTKVGLLLGEWFGMDLKEIGALSDADMLVPVPLHRKKLALRGYNQSEIITSGISKSTGIIMMTDVLVRLEDSSSLTKRSRWGRWKVSESIYSIAFPDLIKNKHVVIVDDVITSGATFEVTGNLLLNAGASKVTVLALAVAV